VKTKTRPQSEIEERRVFTIPTYIRSEKAAFKGVPVLGVHALVGWASSCDMGEHTSLYRGPVLSLRALEA